MARKNSPTPLRLLLPLRPVAEKISAMNTAAFFEERQARSDRRTFRRILNRKGGERPRPGNEL